MRNRPLRLDRVAVMVRETKTALQYFSGCLGLEVVHDEIISSPHVRLTYLDSGNTFIQLIEPLDSDSEIGRSLRQNGEGLHHICFGADDPLAAAAELSGEIGTSPDVREGRGRRSAFVPGELQHGVQIEFTEFHYSEDVQQRTGWLT